MSSSTPDLAVKPGTPAAVEATIEKLKDRTEPAPELTPPAPKVPYVVNSSPVKATVQLRNANGAEDYMHVMGRRHVRLPAGHTVDRNYLVLNKHIKVIEV